MAVTITAKQGTAAKPVAKKPSAAETKAAAKKTVASPAVVAVTSTISGFTSKVDRLAAIAKELAPFSDLLKEQAAIEKELRAVADTKAPADEAVVFPGTEFTYGLTACGHQRTIKSMPEVAKAMGPKLFMSVAKVTLGDIDKYLSEEQRGPLLDETQTGPRKTVGLQIKG